MSAKEKIIYIPTGPVHSSVNGRFKTTQLMWRELVVSKELAWGLFRRDFTSRYRQSILGVTWSFILPLGTIAMFTLMNYSGILTIQNMDIPYPLYALIGLTLWNFFSGGVGACTSSLVNAGSMVVKINFPKIALILSATGQSLIDLLIRTIPVACTFIYFGVIPNWIGLFESMICIIPLLLFMLGIGFFLSLFTVVVRDVPNILNIALTGIMLLSPILYPISGDTPLASLNTWNPFNYLINVPRDLMLAGHTRFFAEYIWSSLLSVVIFFIGWRVFFLSQTKIAERL